MLGLGHRTQLFVLFLLVAGLATDAVPLADPGVEEMKARVATISVGDRPHLCVQIAERELADVDKLYTAADIEHAQTELNDVVTYSEMARDYSIQSHKYQKQTEIAVRVMTRKLTEVLHLLSHDDQAPVREAITRMQRVRDDLLAAMFKKGAK